jgi:hypothetical protein
MLNLNRYLRKNSSWKLAKYYFSQVSDPNKTSNIDKIIDRYHIEQLLAYKEIHPEENDFKRMRLPPNATVKQIYTSYINHSKLFNNPDIPDKEVRTI